MSREHSPNPITFDEALRRTDDRQRHVLLGNGFSIAAHPRFAYGRLYDVAVGMNGSLANYFQRRGNPNFEDALRKVEDSDAAHAIRSGLIKAIARVHPHKYRSISDDRYRACGIFLEDFVGLKRGVQRGLVFTTNYDLLLYWAVMKHKKDLRAYDGFDNEGVWKTGSPTQLVYLHGGLHLFERRARPLPGAELGFKPLSHPSIKLLWQPEQPLLTQVQAKLEADHLPIFVSEGTSFEKQRTIRRSAYLKKAAKTFKDKCDEEGAVLFTIGHSLSEYDAHITDVIGGGRIDRVFIGFYSDADRERAAWLAASWSNRRAIEGLPALSVSTFPVAECSMWEPGNAA